MHKEIKNDAEIRKYNCSNWNISCSSIKMQFGVINWTLEAIRKIDWKTREVKTVYKMHHPKADIYIYKAEGGRGLLQIEATYKTEIINTAEYLNTKYAEYKFVNTVKSHESNQPNMNSTTNGSKGYRRIKPIK
jgi:hypothetical protein